jgi:hypothetical protein
MAIKTLAHASTEARRRWGPRAVVREVNGVLFIFVGAFVKARASQAEVAVAEGQGESRYDVLFADADRRAKGGAA